MTKLRVLSLFAGIGGFDLGLERTGGFKTVAVAEVDPFASRILAERFPHAVNVGDVTTAEYPDADFICAGFPCQDISFAGAGAGLAGARSGLWREVVRAIRVVRPRGALLENVAALLNRGLDRVLGDLAEVGHDAEWHCIPASAVGAPHRRDRIWIVTDARGEQHEGDRAPISGEIAAELSRAFTDVDEQRAQISEARGIAAIEISGSLARDRTMADAAGNGCGQGHSDTGRSGEGSSPRQEPGLGRSRGWWSAEPNVGRVAHGVPQRVDRLKALGNAVVPQIPEMIGRAILETRRLTPTIRGNHG